MSVFNERIFLSTTYNLINIKIEGGQMIIKSLNTALEFNYKSIIYVLFFNTFVFFAYANSDSEIWHVSDDENYTYIDSWGTISKTDLLAISLNKNDCDNFWIDLYISSKGKELAKEGQIFNLEIVEVHQNANENSLEYKSEVFISYLEPVNESLVYILSFNYSWDTELWIDRLQEVGPLSIYMELVEHADYPQDPSHYFEHTANLWDFTNLNEILSREYRNCRFKNQTDNEV